MHAPLVVPRRRALAVTPIGQTSHPSPIRAYRDQAVFSTAPAGSKTFTLNLAGAGRRAAARRRGRAHRCEADVSRGPDGKPAIIVAQTRAIYPLDPRPARAGGIAHDA